MIHLEKYKGSRSRFTCPNCHTKGAFVRYVGDNGNYLAETVGRCNRESKCGYHKKPKEYFAENPSLSKFSKDRIKRVIKPDKSDAIKGAEFGFDSVPFDFFKNTLGDYGQNSFVRFLADLFSDNLDAVRDVLQKYYVGTWKDDLTIFWQIDRKGRIRTGKIMRFDTQTGKRQIVRSWTENGETKNLKTDWIHGKINKDFRLKQCFFGEHLLKKEPGKRIAIVEAEKTALICAICFPEMLWLSVGAKGYLTKEKLQVFSGCKVLLFPDADAYSEWHEKAVKAQRKGLDISVSSIIETHGTNTEKQEGFDLADYLITEVRQKRLHKTSYESLINSRHFRGWTSLSLF